MEDPVISGVPLTQYAAVTAALGEAFPLKAVLSVEGLTPARWTEADRGWTARLAEDAALLARYETELSTARDRLARTVEPIDTDLGAWVAFRTALGSSPDPDGLLAQLGVSPDDASRLQRRWDARMRDEPTLQKRVVEILQQGPGKVPPLRVVKGKLTRSGVGLAPAPATGSMPAAMPPPPVPAPLAPPVAPPAPLPPPVAPPAPLPPPAMVPAPLPPPAAVPAPPQPRPPPPVPAPAPAAVSGPRIVLPPLPPVPRALRGAAAPQPHAAEEPHRAPPPPPPPSDDESTRIGVQGLSTTLPFGATPSREFLDAMERPGAAPGEGSDGSTVALRVSASLRDLPMPGDEPAPDSSPSQAPTKKMPPKRPPLPREEMTMTEVVSPAVQARLQQLKPLPFEASPEAPPAREEPPARGGLPFVEAPPAREASPAPVPVGTEPPLSLEQHASLCVEIAFYPSHLADVLARYQVNAADVARADAFYRARMDADPEVRTRWNRAFEIYRAWLASGGRT